MIILIRWILITVLSIGIIGVGIYGYQEHQEKSSVLIQAENNYQRAFHELTYHMDLLHNKIGTSLAMNSPKSLSPQLIEIWRITSQASSDVGQLPLTLVPFNKTEEFLANIGDFTYKAAVRDLKKEPLSKEETKRLKKLYEESGNVKKELRKVQYLVLKNNLRWMDVQLALATNDEQTDNTIIDGFKTVEKNVEGYSEGNFGPTVGVSNKNHGYKSLRGKELSESEIIKKAQEIFNIEKESINVTKSGKGADVPTYSVSYNEDGHHGYMDMSVKGGYPINIIVERKLKKPSISLYEGKEKAEKLLQKHSFKQMGLFQSSQYDNVGVYSFVFMQDDVKIYPDAIQVKVALDNGDIIGLATREYLMNHSKRTLSEPKVTVEEAKEKVNPNVDIQENNLAVIENDLNEEVLCYEFLGVMGESTYRIFINAANGDEEKVEKLKQTETNFDTLT